MSKRTTLSGARIGQPLNTQFQQMAEEMKAPEKMPEKKKPEKKTLEKKKEEKPEEMTAVSVKMSKSERDAFKVYCITHGLQMSEAFAEAVREYMKNHK